MKGIVYKVTNQINNRVYIGQCYRSKDYNSEKLLQLRKNKHTSEANKYKRNFPFHNALSKYNREDFKWEVILCSWCKEDLNYYESYYIKHYNSLIDNEGYNCSTGGNNNKFTKRTRKAQSKAAKERWKKEGHLITKAQLEGKKNNPEFSRKMANQAKKNLHSKKARAKASKSIAETWRKPEYRKLKSEQSVEMWSSKTKQEKKELLNKGLHSKTSRIKTADSNSKALLVVENSTGKVEGIYKNANAVASKFNVSPSGVRSVLSSKSRAKNICAGKYTVKYKDNKE